ncbi:uncharacterized protein LOC106463046, partial [Limulus polyphemus]|uniref:Uncharacterized protein LOC106463046 n=1 Tax=Limulus polyphemus TaxID=6850 RepID=A0ABM1SRA4_LIMPO
DHIQEVLNKWDQIDDEIWAKIICMERYRRVAKAYARTPVLTINGSDDGFDGYRIGLCGFDNPMRDSETEEVKRHIGNVSAEILIRLFFQRSSAGAPQLAVLKLFDMKKFQHNVSRELRRAYPDRRKLETQCVSAVAFVKDAAELLECPCWVMMINIVALDMLKSKLPFMSKKQTTPTLINMFDGPRLPVPEEDPYSVPYPGMSSRSISAQRESRDKPPKLPPRDLSHISVPKPDYDDQKQEENFKFPPVQSSTRNKKSGHQDDPYYCGLRARVPNFAKRGKNEVKKTHSSGYLNLLRSQERSSHASILGSEGLISKEEQYKRIYSRLRPQPHHHYPPRELYVGEWE